MRDDLAAAQARIAARFGVEVDPSRGLVPAGAPYLGLPPGWRFLLAPDYEDDWLDEGLLL